jgi:hypothetical protein
MATVRPLIQSTAPSDVHQIDYADHAHSHQSAG